MGIDILSVKPHVVSKDLTGYTMLFYGQPKSGKTTIASKFEKALLLGFETGYLAIPGVMALPIQKWSEFKQVLKQLRSDEAHDMYKNIIIDTVDISYDLCEKYICNQEGVEKIGDLPYGQGYAKTGKEFDEALRLIPQMGYGLIMISHSQDKTFTDEDGKEYNQICPTLANRPSLIVDRMSDVIGYAHPLQDDETGNVSVRLYMRGTPRFVAGSRFKYTPDYIDFNYDSLVKAIDNAIDMQAKENNGELVTETRTDAYEEQTEFDFDAMMDEFNEIVEKIQKATGEDFGKKWAKKIQSIVSKYLGVGKKVSETTPQQAEQLDMILSDLKDELANGL